MKPENLEPSVRKIGISAKVCASHMKIVQRTVNFGIVNEGSKSDMKIYIYNESAIPLVYKVKKSGNLDSSFIHIKDSAKGIIKPYGNSSIPVVFLPTIMKGKINEKITIKNILDNNDTQEITLKAYVKKPSHFSLEKNIQRISFGEVCIGNESQQMSFVLRNTSSKQRVFQVYSDPILPQQFGNISVTPFLIVSASTVGTICLSDEKRIQYEEEMEKLKRKARIHRRKGRPEMAGRVKAQIDRLQTIVNGQSLSDENENTNTSAATNTATTNDSATTPISSPVPFLTPPNNNNKNNTSNNTDQILVEEIRPKNGLRITLKPDVSVCIYVAFSTKFVSYINVSKNERESKSHSINLSGKITVSEARYDDEEGRKKIDFDVEIINPYERVNEETNISCNSEGSMKKNRIRKYSYSSASEISDSTLNKKSLLPSLKGKIICSIAKEFLVEGSTNKILLRNTNQTTITLISKSPYPSFVAISIPDYETDYGTIQFNLNDESSKNLQLIPESQSLLLSSSPSSSSSAAISASSSSSSILQTTTIISNEEKGSGMKSPKNYNTDLKFIIPAFNTVTIYVTCELIDRIDKIKENYQISTVKISSILDSTIIEEIPLYIAPITPSFRVNSNELSLEPCGTYILGSTLTTNIRVCNLSKKQLTLKLSHIDNKKVLYNIKYNETIILKKKDNITITIKCIPFFYITQLSFSLLIKNTDFPYDQIPININGNITNSICFDFIDKKDMCINFGLCPIMKYDVNVNNKGFEQLTKIESINIKNISTLNILLKVYSNISKQCEVWADPEGLVPLEYIKMKTNETITCYIGLYPYLPQDNQESGKCREIKGGLIFQAYHFSNTKTIEEIKNSSPIYKAVMDIKAIVGVSILSVDQTSITTEIIYNSNGISPPSNTIISLYNNSTHLLLPFHIAVESYSPANLVSFSFKPSSSVIKPLNYEMINIELIPKSCGLFNLILRVYNNNYINNYQTIAITGIIDEECINISVLKPEEDNTIPLQLTSPLLLSPSNSNHSFHKISTQYSPYSERTILRYALGRVLITPVDGCYSYKILGRTTECVSNSSTTTPPQTSDKSEEKKHLEIEVEDNENDNKKENELLEITNISDKCIKIFPASNLPLVIKWITITPIETSDYDFNSDSTNICDKNSLNIIGECIIIPPGTSVCAKLQFNEEIPV